MLRKIATEAIRSGGEVNRLIGDVVLNRAAGKPSQEGRGTQWLDCIHERLSGRRVGSLACYGPHPVLATIVGAILDEVIGPDMIALLRPQPDALSMPFQISPNVPK